MRKILLFLALGVCLGGTAQPVISSFSPTSAGAGKSLTITGTNFTGATAVTIGGTSAASFSVLSSTTIVAVVGNGTSGSISITTGGGSDALPGFTFIPAPAIASFTPLSATFGQTVTITGTDLTGTTAVSFGGIAAGSFSVLSPTSLTAVVGAGSSGSISVTTAGGTVGFSGFSFVTPPAPTIASFSPLTATTGTTITINGTNFGTTTAVTLVYGARWGKEYCSWM